MMSSNSSSTDPAEEFPEVDDYSEVDDLDTIAAELAAELRSSNGSAPEAPVEPTAADHGAGDADASSPEALAAALAEQVGLDLNGDSPIAPGPVDLVEQGLADDDDGHPAAARAGWFPPATDGGEIAGHEAAGGADGVVDHGEQFGHDGPGRADHTGRDGGGAVMDPTDGESGLGHAAGSGGIDDGAPRPQSETFDRPPSSPPIERAPLAPEPPVAPVPPRAEPEDEAKAVHPVDQIAVRKLGGFNFLSIGQWSALPRDERARLLKGGLVMFLSEGEEVPVRPALLWLQQIARSEAVGPDDPPVRRRGR